MAVRGENNWHNGYAKIILALLGHAKFTHALITRTTCLYLKEQFNHHYMMR